MVRILSQGTPVLLFCRLRTKESGRQAPFVYVGRVQAERAIGQNPVSVLFTVLDHQQTPNNKLAELYNWRPSGGRKVHPVEMPDDKSAPLSGQGRMMDSRKRQAVDAWAMLKARQHYEALGYVIEDTSKVRPFDYAASKNGEQRRLEVKGLTGGLGPVIVTVGEVQSAKDANIRTDLVIIHDIELMEISAGVFQGKGGEVYVIQNWIPEDRQLKPLQYEYLL